MKQQAFNYWITFLCTLLFLPGIIMAQGVSVKGSVIDAENNDPLPGVNIQIEGTQQGTTTDIEGNYSLTVQGTQTSLIFSYIGYISQRILVGEQTVINVNLVPDIKAIEDVIVIGYGTQKKVDKTGAVSHITSDELQKGVLTDPVQGIQGKIAGVLVTKKGGDPNAGFTVRIRGAAGFSSDTQPLYVIDGIPNADPTAIAPEDIESYSVLKDAASAAIYGSQGSNGVILITTRKGTAGKGMLQFNVRVSADRVAKKFDVLNASQMRQYVDEYDLEFIDGGANIDWQDQIFRTGITQNYNLSYSGGNERSGYFGSITHSSWQGVMKGTEKSRTIGKVNLMHKALNDRLTLSGSISGSFEDNDYESYDGFDKDDIIYQAISHNPTDPVRDTVTGGYHKTIRAFNYENPLAVIDGIDNIRTAKSFFGAFKADMEILKGLTGSVNVGYTLDDRESSYFRPKGTVYAAADNGYGRKGFDKEQQKLIETTGTYIKYIGVHNFNLMAGYSWQQTNYNGFYAQAENPQSDFIKYNNLGSFIDITSSSIGSWSGESRLIGFFGRLQYNFDSRYYLTGSIRRDGSSRFGENNKWGWFPTVSAGWNIDRESFMQNFGVINLLKLRASYGISGNQKIGDYHSKVIFEPSGSAIDPETGQRVTTFSPAWNANPDLKWERTSEVNIGLDFAILRNRVSGSLELYSKITDDLLDAYPVPVPPNLARTTWANSGSMRNRGIELFIQAFVVDRSDIKWKTTFNVSHFKTINTDLGEFVESYRQNGHLTGRGLIGEQNFVTGNIKGEELGSFYLPKYMGLSSDGYFLYESTTGGVTRELTSAQRYLAGSPAPDLEIGWSNSIGFLKNFELDFTFRSILGNDVYNATRMFFDYPGLLPSLNASPEALKWKEQGRTQGPAIADIYVEDGSFVRLDYISLGYNFVPKSGVVKNLKVSISSNNLFVITNYTGADPETNYEGLSFGIDQYNVYPKTRTLTLGLSATF